MAVYDEFVHKLVAKTSELRLGMVKQAGEGGDRCMISTPKSGKAAQCGCAAAYPICDHPSSG